MPSRVVGTANEIVERDVEVIGEGEKFLKSWLSLSVFVALITKRR